MPDFTSSWSLMANSTRAQTYLSPVAILATTVGIFVVWAVTNCIYCLYFHPLAKFPGPKLAAVSNIYYALTWLSGRFVWTVEDLHKKYGDVVRIAPNELVFCSPNAFQDIYGTAVRNREVFVKTPFSEISPKDPAIGTEQDPEVHRDLARRLHPAFSARAIRAQEPVVDSLVDQFVRRLEEIATRDASVERGIEMREVMDWLLFDIAGEVTYGRQFNQVRDEKPADMLSLFQKCGLWGTINQVSRRYPLLRPFIWFLIPPSVALIAPKLFRLNRQEIRARMNRRGDLPHPDYMQLLIPESSEKDAAVDFSEDYLLAQANNLMVASFDPMSNLMTAILHYACGSPEKLQKLTSEIRGSFGSCLDITPTALCGLSYLQAVIDEGLRIHTGAAFGLPRVSPGRTVGGHFVPKGTVVQSCQYATTHDESYFALPNEFHPERWLPSSHPYFDPRFAQDNKKAAFPFSVGPRGCAGYNVAYMQTRLILAKMLWTFDIELANGYDVDWVRDTRLYGVYNRPEVWLSVTKAAPNSSSVHKK